MTTWAVALALLFAGLSQAAPIKTEHAEVELIAEKTALVVGEKNTIGLSIKHAPHWHTYWKNPGDSGYPTKITWQVPAGYGVGEFDWPTPKRLATGPIINFGYEGEVVLPLTVSVPTSAKPGDGITLKGKAEWLVCKDVCIPEEGEVAVTLPVGEKGKDAPAGPAAARFVAARAAQPGDASAWKATLYAAPNPTREVWLDVTAPANTGNLTGLDVFPVQEQISDPSVQQVYRTERGYAVKLKLVDGAKLTDSFPVLLAAVGAPVGAKGELSGNTLATVSTSAFALPAGATALAATGAASGATSGGTDLTFWSALALAFVGGMILNLMPCVFPVLSLKILSFAQHSGSAANGAKQMRQHGIFYAVGVVLSFLVLAGALLALKGAGSAVGWGFQLQNPGVVWVLAVIFFLIGLNLMGAFEVGQLAPSSLLSMQAKHPGVDAFFSGVLAVTAASPCTAPFMAPRSGSR